MPMANSLLTRVIIILGLISFSPTVYGQDFSIPPAWRKPSTALSKGTIEGMAQSVVNSLAPLFGPSGVIPDLTNDQPAYTIAAISRTDYLSGNTTYKQLVLNSMKTVFTPSPNILLSTNHNSQVVMWGLAAASAYRAYNDSASLGYAQAAWDQISPFQIQASDATKGFASAVNASIPSVCNGSTVAGGVFAYPIHSTFHGAVDPQPTDVDGETVAAFVALSGHLFEFTGDSKYLNAAVNGATFIQNHMQAYPVIMDTFTVATCAANKIAFFTYVSGFTIWGLSILATHNSTWMPVMNNLVLSSVPYSGWTSTIDGIVSEQTPDPATDNVVTCLKAVWIRGLHEAWTRMDTTSDVAIYIQSYLYVQFNALRDLAYNAGIDAYSPIWTGPPVAKLFSWGQLDALDVLNSAFSMAHDSTSPDTTASYTGSDVPSSLHHIPASTASSSSTSSQPSKRPVIIGAAIGSFVAIAAGCLIAFFIIRRQKAKARVMRYGQVAPYVVKPYVAPPPPPPREPVLPSWVDEKRGYAASSTGTTVY